VFLKKGSSRGEGTTNLDEIGGDRAKSPQIKKGHWDQERGC